MKRTTKNSFQPTAKARVVPRNRRTEVAGEARKHLLLIVEKKSDDPPRGNGPTSIRESAI
jgi:hypothetical protein